MMHQYSPTPEPEPEPNEEELEKELEAEVITDDTEKAEVPAVEEVTSKVSIQVEAPIEKQIVAKTEKQSPVEEVKKKEEKAVEEREGEEPFAAPPVLMGLPGIKPQLSPKKDIFIVEEDLLPDLPDFFLLEPRWLPYQPILPRLALHRGVAQIGRATPL